MTTVVGRWCDLHYDFDDCVQCMPPVAEPSAVYVAVCVYTKAVVIQNQPAITPLETQGRMGIFNRPQATTEERLGVQIVAVTNGEREANQAVNEHKAANPHIGGEYLVERHMVGLAPASTPSAPARNMCRSCGKVELPSDRVRCGPCQQAHWDNGGWVPQGKGEE